MGITKEFEKWGLGYSGCNGGDIGSPESPSVWICGIEWGGGHTPDGLISHMKDDVTRPPSGYDHWKTNLAYIYNRQVLKILSVMQGGKTSDYKQFAENVRPFTTGNFGYFQMNLYPIAFKNTSHSMWHENFSKITGFERKADYLAWCTESRFSVMRKWAEKAKPKLILCLGKTYLENFKLAFHNKDAEFTHEIIDDKDLLWSKNSQGTLVAIIPFMVNRYGLVKNISIQKFGNRLSELLRNL